MSEVKDQKPTKFVSPALTITSKVAGFRRAGIAHPGTPTDHKAGTFSEEQLEQLKADPNLIVVEKAK